MSLSDRILDHLSDVIEHPDLSGTRYEIVRAIGQGGMGTVYHARDRELERDVALKVIDRAVMHSQEARLLAQLEHPGIVTVHDAGTLANGDVFCVMQLVEGVALTQFLRTSPGMAQVLSVFKKLCDAVAFAHSKGVIHRDLKPANVVVGSFGRVVVLDWGVALRISETAREEKTVAGTWPYMAPEQKSGAQMDVRTDVYALGLLLREMVPENAPRPLLAIAAKAASEDRAARYSNVPELLHDLELYQERLPVSAYRASPWEAAARYAVRNRVLLLLVAAYVLVRILLFFVQPH